MVHREVHVEEQLLHQRAVRRLHARVVERGARRHAARQLLVDAAPRGLLQPLRLRRAAHEAALRAVPRSVLPKQPRGVRRAPARAAPRRRRGLVGSSCACGWTFRKMSSGSGATHNRATIGAQLALQ